MYCAHFRLTERPFGNAPGQRFFVPNAAVTEVLTRLQHALTGRDTIALVTGGPGIGKSSLVARAARQLGDELALAHADMRAAEPAEIFAALLLSLGEQPQETGETAHLLQLAQAFAERRQQGRRAAVALDVGAITVEVAKRLLRLAHQAGEATGSMSLVLMGPHNLHQVLDQPGLIHMRQRLALRYRVRPFSLVETSDYLKHQIAKAGGDPSELLAPNAAAMACRYVAGVPRLLNTLMDTALATAAMQRATQLSAEMIARTAEGLGWRPLQASRPKLTPRTAGRRSVDTSPEAAGRRASDNSPMPAARPGDVVPLKPPKTGAAPPSSEAPVKSPRAADEPARQQAETPAAVLQRLTAEAQGRGSPGAEASDLSATGMLRLEDLDDRFAETIFSEGSDVRRALNEMRRQALQEKED